MQNNEFWLKKMTKPKKKNYKNTKNGSTFSKYLYNFVIFYFDLQRIDNSVVLKIL